MYRARDLASDAARRSAGVGWRPLPVAPYGRLSGSGSSRFLAEFDGTTGQPLRSSDLQAPGGAISYARVDHALFERAVLRWRIDRRRVGQIASSVRSASCDSQ